MKHLHQRPFLGSGHIAPLRFLFLLFSDVQDDGLFFAFFKSVPELDGVDDVFVFRSLGHR